MTEEEMRKMSGTIRTIFIMQMTILCIMIVLLTMALASPVDAAPKHDCRTQSNWCDQHGYGPGYTAHGGAGYGHTRR